MALRDVFSVKGCWIDLVVNDATTCLVLKVKQPLVLLSVGELLSVHMFFATWIYLKVVSSVINSNFDSLFSYGLRPELCSKMLVTIFAHAA